jgi:hypothetical protein
MSAEGSVERSCPPSVNNYLRQPINKLYKVPSGFLNRVWIGVLAAGAVVGALPGDIQDHIPYAQQVSVALVAIGTTFGILKDEFVKKDASRRAAKLLAKCEKAIVAGKIETYSAIAVINEVDDYLEVYQARGRYNKHIVAASRAIFVKLLADINASRIGEMDAWQQFSLMADKLSTKEQDSISDAIMAVRKRLSRVPGQAA